jgi:hypothetical protein
MINMVEILNLAKNIPKVCTNFCSVQTLTLSKLGGNLRGFPFIHDEKSGGRG